MSISRRGSIMYDMQICIDKNIQMTLYKELQTFKENSIDMF
jgi:hypothetical protein